MKLRGHDVIAANAADERAAVIGFGGDDGRVIGDDVIAVNEIKRTADGQAIEQRRGISEDELVPAHVGNFEAEG